AKVSQATLTSQTQTRDNEIPASDAAAQPKQYRVFPRVVVVDGVCWPLPTNWGRVTLVLTDYTESDRENSSCRLADHPSAMWEKGNNHFYEKSISRPLHPEPPVLICN